MIDKEMFERLKPYEGHLYTALYCQFVRLNNNDEKLQLAQLHKEIFGNDGNIATGCNRCVLNGIREIANEYYKFKKQEEADKKFEKEIKVVGKQPEPKNKKADNQAVKKTVKKSATTKKK